MTENTGEKGGGEEIQMGTRGDIASLVMDECSQTEIVSLDAR